jgi:hypothetical protein
VEVLLPTHQTGYQSIRDIKEAASRTLKEGIVGFSGRSCTGVLYEDYFVCKKPRGNGLNCPFMKSVLSVHLIAFFFSPELVRVNCDVIVGVSVSSFAPVFVIHSYPKKGKARALRDVQITCESRTRCDEWAQAIRCCAEGVAPGGLLTGRDVRFC